jgi:hypothetical protein
VAAGDSETIVIVRTPPRGRFGDPGAGGSPEVEVPECLVAPGSSREQNFGAAQVDTDVSVYCPAGTEVLPTDQIRVRGDLFQVVGEPASWGSFGVVVHLRRVTG